MRGDPSEADIRIRTSHEIGAGVRWPPVARFGAYLIPARAVSLIRGTRLAISRLLHLIQRVPLGLIAPYALANLREVLPDLALSQADVELEFDLVDFKLLFECLILWQ